MIFCIGFPLRSMSLYFSSGKMVVPLIELNFISNFGDSVKQNPSPSSLCVSAWISHTLVKDMTEEQRNTSKTGRLC